MKTVVLIGDSIRMGYQPVVEQLLHEQAQVWAPKPNGGTSRNVLAHLAQWVLSRAPDLVHLNCGLHDLKTEFGAASQAVPLDEYETNLREIVRRILGQSATQLVWATTTPVNEKWHHANKPFDRSEADVQAYNQIAVRLAAEHSVPVNDLYQTVMDAGRDRLLTHDGVHFSQDGYALLGQAVAATIRRFL